MARDEKETILGAELDELIREVRPGIKLPEKAADKGESKDDAESPDAEAAASADTGEDTESAPENKDDNVDSDPENRSADADQ